MKHKILGRLVLYFSIVLLIFACILGTIFLFLFTKHSKEIHRTDLAKRAEMISDTLSDFIRNGNVVGQGGGFGAYLKFLDEIAMSEVWVVDKNAEIVEMGHGASAISYKDLPMDAENLIGKVFEGQIAFSEGMSEQENVPVITVGAPVYDANSQIIAAVLLHSPVDGIGKAVKDGFLLLVISIIGALVLAVGLAVLLSMRFVTPLRTMERVTGRMTDGDYTVQTGVKQEDEIGSLAEKIDILAERLSEAERGKKELERLRREFISNISHELRTPVTVIRGSLETLYDEIITEPDQIKEYYRQMLNDTIHLQRLVNDLLELSRLQNLDFQIEKDEINLIDVLNDTVRSMRTAAKQKNCEVVINENVGQFIINGDYGRLRQMFLIVLDNAIKFSHTNGKVKLDVIQKDLRCEVIIRDYGEGIKAENISHIFERFYHVDSERNSTGTGLGLPIAKQIAERHDILLECKSEQNQYTEFKFTIE